MADGLFGILTIQVVIGAVGSVGILWAVTIFHRIEACDECFAKVPE